MSIFKAYDIRGVVGESLDADLAWAIGVGYTKFIAQESGKSAPLLVVGRDMRTHGDEIAGAFMQGCASAGARVMDAGLCSTPMVYFACAGAWLGDNAPDGGAAVTASHNGPAYNGFKLSRKSAVPISGASGLKEIEKLALDALAKRAESSTDHAAIQTTLPPLDAESWQLDAPAPGVNATIWQGYANFLRGFKLDWPNAIKIAADPANGMGCLYPSLLQALGAEVTSVNDSFDGTFPAHEANPIKAENMQQLSALVKESGAALGVAFDGDADRVAFCDEQGDILSCDLITALIARDLLTREKGAAILYDLRSSHALPETIKQAGGRPVRDRVGHSFMKATMRKEECAFGGELSGHYYYRDAFYADSAVITVIALLNLLGASDKPLSVLASEVRAHAQSGEINFRVKDVTSVLSAIEERFSDAEIDHLDGITVSYADWWFNLRASNTEPLLRLNLEAGDSASVESNVAVVAEIIGGERE